MATASSSKVPKNARLGWTERKGGLLARKGTRTLSNGFYALPNQALGLAPKDWFKRGSKALSAFSVLSDLGIEGHHFYYRFSDHLKTEFAFPSGEIEPGVFVPLNLLEALRKVLEGEHDLHPKDAQVQPVFALDWREVKYRAVSRTNNQLRDLFNRKRLVYGEEEGWVSYYGRSYHEFNPMEAALARWSERRLGVRLVIPPSFRDPLGKVVDPYLGKSEVENENR
jgi:hypothetical protein